MFGLLYFFLVIVCLVWLFILLVYLVLCNKIKFFIFFCFLLLLFCIVFFFIILVNFFKECLSFRVREGRLYFWYFFFVSFEGFVFIFLIVFIILLNFFGLMKLVNIVVFVDKYFNDIKSCFSCCNFCLILGNFFFFIFFSIVDLKDIKLLLDCIVFKILLDFIFVNIFWMFFCKFEFLCKFE